MKTKKFVITKTVKLINVNRILHDLKSEAADEDLMEKYHLSLKQLEKVYIKLYYGGHLSRSDMRKRIRMRLGKRNFHIPFAEMSNEDGFLCSKCGYISHLHFSKCPRCEQLNVRRLTSVSQRHDHIPISAVMFAS